MACVERVDSVDIGDKLRSLREDRGMSTTELARLSGLSQSFISDIENKRRTSPRQQTIEKLAKALRVSPNYFFDESLVTPLDVFKEANRQVSDEIKEFILDQENMPYMKFSKKVKEKGYTPEQLEQFEKFLDTLIK